MGTIRLPTNALCIQDVNTYAKNLKIPNYVGCHMIDLLPQCPRKKECGILNLEPSTEKGSHWVCWYKNGKDRIYFDSFGEPPPPELEAYLKTKKELKESKLCLKQSSVTVQKDDSSECGSLCLYVIYNLNKGHSFEKILDVLSDRYQKPYPLIIHNV